MQIATFPKPGRPLACQSSSPRPAAPLNVKPEPAERPGADALSGDRDSLSLGTSQPPLCEGKFIPNTGNLLIDTAVNLIEAIGEAAFPEIVKLAGEALANWVFAEAKKKIAQGKGESTAAPEVKSQAVSLGSPFSASSLVGSPVSGSSANPTTLAILFS